MPKQIDLYDDQLEFVSAIRAKIKEGNQSVLGVASTGFGKTIVSAYIAKSAVQRGKTVWFVCHLKNLLWQTSKAFWSLGIEHGQIASGKRTSPLPAKVGTIGTITRRLDKLEAPDLLILDESHLAMAASWLTLVDWAKERGSTIIGNSATPERLDGKGLDYIFDDMVEARPMRWLINHGRLSDYVIYSAPNTPDLSAVKTQAGDYKSSDAAQAMDKPVIVGDAASHWNKYAYGKRTIAYCVNIDHSKHVAEQLNEYGIPTVHVDGETPADELRRAIEGFADGKYKVLCNVQLMTTGFDLSAQVGREVPIEACIMLRPTQSLAMYLQMAGRALRKKDEPAIILDHAGNARRHGLPCDERAWSLQGRTAKKRRADQEVAEVVTQQCPHCFHIFKPGVDACPRCLEPVEKKERPPIEVVDGELYRIEMDQLRQEQNKERRRQIGRARSLSDLVAVGLQRGVNNPDGWAAFQYAGRQKRKPTKQEFAEAARVKHEILRGEQASA